MLGLLVFKKCSCEMVRRAEGMANIAETKLSASGPVGGSNNNVTETKSLTILAVDINGAESLQ